MSDQEPVENEMDECQPVTKAIAKPKRRRRGKRRKHNKSSEVEGGDSSGETAPIESKKKFRKLLIRPVDAPNAPRNTSQFIIDDHYHYDDHYDECHLYINFESPYPQQDDTTRSQAYEEALEDIDYEYESMKDMDNSAYYLRDFEVSYANMRYEELLRMSRSELVSRIEAMESETKHLETEFIECDPNSALEQLQQKLLLLQEENASLKADNSSLRVSVESTKVDNVVLQEDSKNSAEHEDTDECDDDDDCSSQEDEEEYPGLIRKDGDYLNKKYKSNELSGESSGETDDESDEEEGLYSSTDSLVNEHLAVTYSQSCDINSNWENKTETSPSEPYHDGANDSMVVDSSLLHPFENLTGEKSSV